MAKAPHTQLESVSCMLDAAAERVWLHLRNQGGWWSAEELHEFWYPTFTPRWLQDLLPWLASHGFAAERVDIDKGGRVYGVTNACTALPGHDLEPRPC